MQRKSKVEIYAKTLALVLTFALVLEAASTSLFAGPPDGLANEGETRWEAAISGAGPQPAPPYEATEPTAVSAGPVIQTEIASPAALQAANFFAAGLPGETGIPDTSWYTTPGSADGSESNPYIINSADQLAGLAEIVNGTAADIPQDSFTGKHIMLVNDIDLSAYGESYNGGCGWTPIGWWDFGHDANGNEYSIDYTFKGIFNGNEKVIENLYIRKPVVSNQMAFVGLFGLVGPINNNTSGYLGSKIASLGLRNMDIVIPSGSVAYSYTGGIVGMLLNGAIENCYVTGKIDVYNSMVGALVGGIATGVRIANCYSSCDVTSSYAGGLVGQFGISIDDTVLSETVLSENIIENCYTTGKVSGYYEAGGIVGSMIIELYGVDVSDVPMPLAIIKNCAALNSTVEYGSESRRIAVLYTNLPNLSNFLITRGFTA